MDIVGYSKLRIDEQRERIRELQDIVRNTDEFRRAQNTNEFLCLPTGDGMALVFFDDQEAAIRCAVEIGRTLRTRRDIPLRIGINTGPVYRIADINANMNVTGGGINIAQRVMDCGDAGHIILSKEIADALRQVGQWAKHMHSLGDVVVKHGIRVPLVNFYSDEVGNSNTPSRMRAKKSLKKLLMIACVILMSAALFWGVTRLHKNNRAVNVQIAPTNSASEHTFSYSMIVQKYRNGRPYKKPFTIPGEITFERDDKVKLLFTSDKQGYLYVINKGPESSGRNWLVTLFPDSDRSAIVEPNQTLPIPPVSQTPDNDWIEFDKDVGTEELWIIWSMQPIPLLEEIKKWLNSTDRGEIKNFNQDLAVRAFLESNEGKLPEGKKNPEGTKTTFLGKGDIVAYRLRLQHY